MKTILLALLISVTACHGQRISALTATNIVVGTNVLPVSIYPNTANGTRGVTIANLFSNRTYLGWAQFDGPLTNAGAFYGNSNGIAFRGTNVISGAATLGEMGAHLFTDGTNFIAIFQNKAGVRTTNKLSMTAWP